MKKIFLSILIFIMAAFSSAQETQVELILDASGSMWNKLSDGTYRIVAAKNVLADFINSLPVDPNLNVGLRIYGSQLSALDDGACEDSELFVGISGINRSKLLSTVKDSKAKGATPIAYSLTLAGQDFSTEGKKVIILVTDGEESCNGDIRAVIEDLKSQGIEFELKIIGLDLDDRAIKSFEGLGSFINTKDAKQLADALGKAIEIEKVAVYPVTAFVTRNGEAAKDGFTLKFVNSVSDESFAFSSEAEAKLTAKMPAGSYRAEIEDAFNKNTLVFSDLNVSADSENIFNFEIMPEQEAKLKVEPLSPVVGSVVKVIYSEAPKAKALITVVPIGTPDNVHLDYEWVDNNQGNVEITIPIDPAELEARFLINLPDGGSRVIGRSESFTSVAATATLDAPSEAPAGSDIEVFWTGPDNRSDLITITKVGAPDSDHLDYSYTSNGSPAEITMPVEVGEYELRYKTGQGNKILIRKTIKATEISATLDAPSEAPAGSDVEVSWTGPSNYGDFITVAIAGAPDDDYLDYEYTSNSNPTTITLAIEVGEYEFRYITGQGGKVLAIKSITTTAISATLNAPAEAPAASEIVVKWTGPAYYGDLITIAKTGSAAGDHLDYEYPSSGSSSGELKLGLPDEAGSYEIRYITDRGKLVLEAIAITVR